MIEIDLVKGRVNLPGFSSRHSYDYTKEKDRYVSTSGRGVTQERHTEQFINQYFTEENERRYIVVKDYADDSGEFQIRGDQYLPEIVMNRIAYRYHLNNTSVLAKLNGRLDLNAGDIVNLKIPEFNFSSTKDLNRQLSGYYMIISLTQSFVRDAHQTSLKLVKYDWSTQE